MIIAAEPSPFRLSRLASGVILACGLYTSLAVAVEPQKPAESANATAATPYFNPAFFKHSGAGNGEAPVDLSLFEKGGQAPGSYRVDIFVNKRRAETQDINFSLDDHGQLVPCLSMAQLKKYGVNTSAYPKLLIKDSSCANIAAIDRFNTFFDFNKQQLQISIPQAALANDVRGYIPPEDWDEGINAVILNYDFTGDQTRQRHGGGSSDTQYANLRPGINIGAWRIRTYSTWNRNDDGESSWDTAYTYAQRDIPAWGSQLTLGESTTNADIFDGVPFTGVQLETDDSMRPDSLRGYAPVVEGVARTNAQIIIRQNNYVIYQNYVSAGAFSIKDLYSTGGSGDLYVTVKEQDGSEQHFIVPYASLTNLQRQGTIDYAITTGRYRPDDGSVDETPFTQVSASYGLPWNLTIYGGGQFASHYQSLAIGLGKNMGNWGALSADVTQSWATPEEPINGDVKERGQSWRLRYSKSILETGTTFTMAGYRYNSDGYFEMADILDTYGNKDNLPDRQRNRWELSLSQPLGPGFGSISGSLVREDYWNTNQQMDSWRISWNNHWRAVSYSLSYSYNKNTQSYDNSERYDKDEVFSLSISVPLDKLLPRAWLSYNLNATKGGDTVHSTTLNGYALEGNALNWSVQQGYTQSDEDDNSYNGSLRATYNGTYGTLQGGYSYDDDSERTDYGLSGALIAHRNGVTLAQELGETNALIKIPEASGVRVVNRDGVSTDFRGYTIVNNLTPYRENEVNLDTETLPTDVDLQDTNRMLVPTRGALVRAEYGANVGERALITLRRPDGSVVPFGAMVTPEGGTDGQSGIVASDGEVYLGGLSDNTTLVALWGNNQTCRFVYHSAEAPSAVGVNMVQGECK
ncbi:TPA: fimbria/pilus outer membrane usher protein [Citrobacter pasteurii]